MLSRSSAVLRGIVFGLVLAALPAPALAQLISLKTVPVAVGDQFMIFPSRNLGMGGVSIALDDALLDPFVNPAKGGRLAQPEFFSAPTVYSISQNSGAVRTLPMGALFSSNAWFGGAVAALQQVEMGEQRFPWFGGTLDFSPLPPGNALSEQSATNKYVHALLGRKLGASVALAGSAMLADLNAVDGVEHLYAGAWNLDQYGHVEDYRLGVTGALSGDRTFEVVLLHNRFSMTHDVTYIDYVLLDSDNNVWGPESRLEENPDKTRTWGVHLGYVQPLGAGDWRIGGILTGNRKQHPKIPNYELQNIPRDPGHSWAYNVGVGLSKTDEFTTFGLDLVYEPAVSHTWQEADVDVLRADGGTIPAGGKTIENRFNFSNAFINVGVSRTVDKAAFQLGLQVRAYDYRLRQKDNVELTSRRQDEQWMEWTPTWGARLTLADLELRYLGRVTTGTGRPGIAWNGAVAERFADAGLASDIVLAPGAPLTLQDATVMTHQIGISLPLR